MTRFRPNRRLDTDLQRQAAYRAGLEKVAQVAQGHAARMARMAGAPWMERKGHDTIEVQHDDGHVLLVNTDYGGHLQEFGSRNNPAHAPLRRGVRAAGLRIGEQ